MREEAQTRNLLPASVFPRLVPTFHLCDVLHAFVLIYIHQPVDEPPRHRGAIGTECHRCDLIVEGEGEGGQIIVNGQRNAMQCKNSKINHLTSKIAHAQTAMLQLNCINYSYSFLPLQALGPIHAQLHLE